MCNLNECHLRSKSALIPVAMAGLCSAPLVLRLRLKLGRRLGLERELCWVLAGELGRVLGGVLQRGGGGRVLRGVAGGRQPPATLPPPGRGRHWDAGRRARARVPRPCPRRGPRHLAHAGGLLGQRGRGRGGCPGRHGGRGRQGAARHGVAGGGGGLLPGEGAGPRGGGARLAAQLPLGPPGGARRRHGTAAWANFKLPRPDLPSVYLSCYLASPLWASCTLYPRVGSETENVPE